MNISRFPISIYPTLLSKETIDRIKKAEIKYFWHSAPCSKFSKKKNKKK